jgi:hypothetical protein
MESHWLAREYIIHSGIASTGTIKAVSRFDERITSRTTIPMDRVSFDFKDQQGIDQRASDIADPGLLGNGQQAPIHYLKNGSSAVIDFTGRRLDLFEIHKQTLIMLTILIVSFFVVWPQINNLINIVNNPATIKSTDIGKSRNQLFVERLKAIKRDQRKTS